MTRYTVFGKATKCPNCHAYLTGHGEVVKCEYCGVTVTVEVPPRERAATPVPGPVPVPVRAPEPTMLVRPARPAARWPYFLTAPIITGGVLFYSYFMQKQAMERSQAVTQQARSHATEIRERACAPGDPLCGGVSATAPVAAARPRSPAVDPICHLSAMEISETLEKERPVVAACFDEAPKNVKTVNADLALVVAPSGAVTDVDITWDGWKPDAKARKCATRKIKAWKMAKPSGDLATRCQARLTIER